MNLNSLGRPDMTIYPVMPSCRSFVSEIAKRAYHRRMTFIRSPLLFRHSLWTWVQEGMDAAHCPKPVVISIAEGAEVETEIARHLAQSSVSGSELASAELPMRRFFALKWADPDGMKKCQDFAAAFIRGLINGGDGNVSLLMELDDETPAEESAHIQIIEFRGAMGRDEMHAYVAMRMLDRTGPGSTHLLRALVGEFAGYDPGLAEQLMKLDDDRLLSLPMTLGDLEATHISLWDQKSVRDGTVATADGSEVAHTLHTWHVFKGRHEQASANARRFLDRAYWRACVRAITPWLEERRHLVISVFDEEIEAVRQRSGGVLTRQLGNSGKAIEIEYDEIDYNVICSHCCPVNTRTDSIGCLTGPVRNCSDVRETLAGWAFSRTG